jgi:hypothetical protein
LIQPSSKSSFYARVATTSATRVFTYEKTHFQLRVWPYNEAQMSGPKLSIRQVSILTALDRDTVSRSLKGLQSEPGAKNARMYEAPAALRAVLAPALAPEGTLEQIKVRNETLNARLKEVELAKRMKELVPAQFSFALIDTFIKFCAGKFEELRHRGVVDGSWISECEDQWTSLYREFVRNYEITSPGSFQDAARFLQPFAARSKPSAT